MDRDKSSKKLSRSRRTSSPYQRSCSQTARRTQSINSQSISMQQSAPQTSQQSDMDEQDKSFEESPKEKKQLDPYEFFSVKTDNTYTCNICQKVGLVCILITFFK
jgi:hypothetical protein